MRTTTLMAIAGLAIGAAATAQIKGPSTLQTPYMLPADPTSGVVTFSIVSNGNGVGTSLDETFTNLDTGVANSYRYAGIPDGMGVLRIAGEDTADTFTAISNHELGNTAGVVRAHGSRGAFVSKWRINRNAGTPNFLSVTGGADLIKRVWLWNTANAATTPPAQYDLFNAATPMPLYSNTTGTYSAFVAATPNGFGRFCSADLAPTSAYFFNGLGTTDRIYLNGEEIGRPGRAFAHIVTGADAGTTYELPEHGKYSWENNLAAPYPQAKTVCIGTDDSSPGLLSLYVGLKQAAGNPVERAGLVGGNFYGFKLNNGVTAETGADILGVAGTPSTSERFSTINLGVDVRFLSGANLFAQLNAAGQIVWGRPEDGAWDPSRTGRFVWANTGFGTIPTRLYEMVFDDITNPVAGGRITMLFDGSNLAGTLAGGFSAPSGTTTANAMDNLCITRFGDVLIQEDVGNNARLGRLWLYRSATDSLLEVAINDASRFAAPIPAPFNQDEETSGIIEAWDEIGPGWYILDMQAHYAIPGELVEGGQMMAVFIPQTLPSPTACPGDANFDKSVTFADLNIILNAFGRTGVGIPGDLNRDGSVNFTDLNTALSNFGVTCP